MPHWVGYIFILNLCSTLLTEVYIVLTLTGKIVSLLNVSLTTSWFYKPTFQFPFLFKLVRSLQWKQLLTVNEIRVQLLISLLVLGHCGNTSPPCLSLSISASSKCHFKCIIKRIFYYVTKEKHSIFNKYII